MPLPALLRPPRAVRLYHGTLASHVPVIRRRGIAPGEGWGGAGTTGAFLSGTPRGALYWAKLTWQREHGEKLEAERFDRMHAHHADSLLGIVVVDVPAAAQARLRADEEQMEDVGEPDMDPADWRRSLLITGDVRYDEKIPPTWIAGTMLPSAIPLEP